MIGEFRHQHVGQEIRASETISDRTCWSRCFNDALTGAASELGPHMTYHLVGGGNAFQFFRHVLAKLAQMTAAIRAAIVSWHVRDHFTRKLFRQRLSPLKR